MSWLKRRRMTATDPEELNLVPIMNMFLVLIPFLLMSASFFHIKAVNTSVPVLSNGSKSNSRLPDDKLTIIIELTIDKIRLTAMSETVSEAVLKEMAAAFSKEPDDSYPLEKLSAYLLDVKNRYPASDTILLIPDDTVQYSAIIRTMDMARKRNKQILFPNVVLSGSLG